MNDELAAMFARIHSEYRSSIEASVRGLSEESFMAATEMFQPFEQDPAKVSYVQIPRETWPAIGRVRVALRHEQKRRADEAALVKETEA